MGEAAVKSGSLRRRAADLFYSQTMLLILILLVVVMSFASKGFLSTGNLFNILRQFAVHGIMACGMTLVIIGKGMDLSAASILALSAVANVMLQPYGYFYAVAGAFVLAAGSASGRAAACWAGSSLQPIREAPASSRAASAAAGLPRSSARRRRCCGSCRAS